MANSNGFGEYSLQMAVGGLSISFQDPIGSNSTKKQMKTCEKCCGIISASKISQRTAASNLV
jgi:hypothetical protein